MMACFWPMNNANIMMRCVRWRQKRPRNQFHVPRIVLPQQCTIWWRIDVLSWRWWLRFCWIWLLWQLRAMMPMTRSCSFWSSWIMFSLVYSEPRSYLNWLGCVSTTSPSHGMCSTWSSSSFPSLLRPCPISSPILFSLPYFASFVYSESHACYVWFEKPRYTNTCSTSD